MYEEIAMNSKPIKFFVPKFGETLLRPTFEFYKILNSVFLSWFRYNASKSIRVGSGRAEPVHHGFRLYGQKNIFCFISHIEKNNNFWDTALFQTLIWLCKEAQNCELVPRRWQSFNGSGRKSYKLRISCKKSTSRHGSTYKFGS